MNSIPRSSRRLAGLAVLLLAGAGLAAAQEEAGAPFRSAASYDPAVPDPVELLGSSPGERWTDHRELMEVVAAIADASPRVDRVPYGRTPEGRELVYLVIGAPERLREAAAVREGLARLADPRRLADDAEREALLDAMPAVVWLSYNVHGNEPSPSECAMEVLYHLAAGRDPAVQELLDQLVVILDPCLNPDGRERYVNWYRSVAGPVPDPHPAAREHSEPAPGGRSNHYYFDLNRDWAFASQPETRARLPHLLSWRPQVHVDFHEMFPESTYFFFPSCEPRNDNFPRSTLEWGERFGAGNAEAFDRHGWAYYTAEDFDLFYPGYGDSWPSMIGAIGMTYEQGGHSAGGLAYRRQDGSILTLRDRTAHHYVASLATLETAASGRRELLADYHDFFASGMREGREGPMREIVLLPGADEAVFARLCQHLLDQGVELDRPDRAFVARGVHDYRGGRRDEGVIPEDAVLVSMAQPMKRLAKTLLEPHATVEEVSFYDLSAWSLPMAYGVDALWLEQAAEVSRRRLTEAPRRPTEGRIADGRVGWVMAWDQACAPRALFDLLAAEVPAAQVRAEFRTAAGHFPAGSIFVRAGEGRRAKLEAVARRHPVRVAAVDSFRSREGVDLGSAAVVPLASPRIAVLASLDQSFGELRFFLEQELAQPFTVIDPDDTRSDLREFNVLMLPSGVRELDRWKDAVQEFGQRGGTVVAMGGSARWMTTERSGLTAATQRVDDEEADDEPDEDEGWRTQAERRRASRLDVLPGSLFEARLDPDHPLCFGLPERMPVLVTGTALFRAGGGELVARIEAERLLSGYAGERSRSAVEGGFWMVQAGLGRGRAILFSERPTYRMGFHGMMRALMNALVVPRS